MFYVYILYSVSGDRFYVGQTDDLNKRIEQHNFSKKNTYTSKYRPWVIKASFCFADRSQALRIEKAIKRQKSRYVIEIIISSISSSSELLKFLRLTGVE